MAAAAGRDVSERLLLDEHVPAAIAERLRDQGFDVQAVVEDPDLTGLDDPALYRVVQESGQRLVTENVKDFRPLMARSLADGKTPAPLLLTTARRHPRHRSAWSSLVEALVQWLTDDDPPKGLEEWL
jgi:hypothetical protein